MDFTRRGWLANLASFLAAGAALQVFGMKRALALPERTSPRQEPPRRTRKIWIGHY